VDFLTRNTCTVRLPPLDRSSGWTTWIFQILLIVQAGQGCRGSKCCRVIFFRFWVLHKKRPPRKLVKTIFEFSVPIFSVCLNIYLSLEKVRKSFSIYEVKVCFLLYNLLYQVSQFPLPTEHLNHRKKNGGFAIDGTPQGFMNGRVEHLLNLSFCYILPVMYKVFY